MNPFAMSPYHLMLMHFPLALWTTAMLVIVIRAFSDGRFARSGDGALTLLLFLGAAGGVLAFIVGFMVWPFEAVSSSPLARNHMLLASWTLAYWIMVLIIRWHGGERVWQGVWRWIMVGLAMLGIGFQTLTGAVGGHLAGNPSAVSAIMSATGWEIYSTFYLPNWVLAVVVISAITLAALGVVGRRADIRAVS